MQEHGKMSITWFGPVPRVTITKPELVREVLSNKFGHFEKLKFGRLQRMLHNGVGNHEGEKWARHRRIINPAFHLEKLKRMLPAFAACCTELVQRWEGLALVAGDAPCEVDVWPDMQNLTGDVISRAAFGSSYLEGRRVFQLQGEQLELFLLAMTKMHIPGYLLLPTKVNRRMKQIAAEIERVLKGIVAKRENAMRAGEATSDDLLGVLLESNMAHCRDSKGAGMGITTDDVIGECKLFYFADAETTSVLLTWTMILLCMHPEWQDRAREEVLRVLGPTGTPDHDGLSRLKVVTMVLYEVLRLYTPVMAIHRETYKPMELGGGGGPAGGARAAAALRPPRQGGVGRRRRQVQAGEVLRGDLQGIRRRTGVLPLWVGPAGYPCMPAMAPYLVYLAEAGGQGPFHDGVYTAGAYGQGGFLPPWMVV
uniref:Secologanin synthase n=1 Tax=Aegilops tauschii TaxID=37682 RepID=M8CDQ6_AEGTA